VKRTKYITSVITLTAIGLMLMLFSTSVFAATKKPISAFTETNDSIAAWQDPDSGLSLYPHGWYIYGFPGPESIAACNPTGKVSETQLKDGGMMYKILLHVKGALMVVTRVIYDEMGEPVDEIVLVEGEMDYTFQATIIVYEGEPGDPVPNLLQIWFPGYFLPPGSAPIGEGIFSHLTGKGTGSFLDADMALYYGFDLEEEVKVKVNEVGLLDKDFEEGHPNYYVDPEMWPVEQFWPVEIVFFH